MPTVIKVNRNGSYRVEGDFTIVDAEGVEYGLAGRTAVTLCRCGHSQNKPFCDASHKHHGFEHTPTAFNLPAPAPKPAA